MAESINFDGANRHFVTPLVDPEADRIQDKKDMFGFNNGIITYTCWELSPAEIMEIAKTGHVWLAVRNGKHPMRATWVGSLSSIKRQCLDYGAFWKRRRPPPAMIEDKREAA